MLAPRDTRPPRSHRRLRAGGALVALAVVLGSAAGVAVGKDTSVEISDFAFKPAEVKVVAGQTVTWQNTSTTQHTVTADDGSFDSGPLGLNDQFANVFGTPGTYAYHCTIHPGMKGSVVVTVAAPTASPKGSLAPTPPAGTLPPDFNTPAPEPTAPPTAQASVVASAAPLGTSTAGPVATPPPAQDGTSGSGPIMLLALAALLLGVAAIAVVIVRGRRSARP
jgi:plastocyanin